MELKKLFYRTRNLILHPKDEWKIIANEALDFKQLLLSVALPFIILGSATLFIGNILQTFTFIGALFSSVVFFISMMGGLYLSGLLIVELSTVFELKKDKNKLFTLIVYSSVALYLAQAIVNISGQLALISIFSLYTFYLFWTGSDIICNIKNKHKTGFVIISVLTIFISYILLQYLLSPILDFINNSGI